MPMEQCCSENEWDLLSCATKIYGVSCPRMRNMKHFKIIYPTPNFKTTNKEFIKYLLQGNSWYPLISNIVPLKADGNGSRNYPPQIDVFSIENGNNLPPSAYKHPRTSEGQQSRYYHFSLTIKSGRLESILRADFDHVIKIRAQERSTREFLCIRY